MKIPWSFPNSLKALVLIAGALLINAALADVPDDSEDPILGGVTLGNPLTIPTQTGTLTYTAGGGAVGNFVVNATPLSTNFGDGNGPILFAASPTPTLTIQFGVDKPNCVPDPNTVGLAKSCPVAQGPGITNLFQMTGSYANLAYSGYNGTQLTGVITQFGFLYTATGIDTFDMRITVTGLPPGAWASFFEFLAFGTLAPTPTPTPTPTLTNTPTPTATPISGQANVNISGFAFAPQTLRISIGTKVTWTNNDSVNHTVTSQDNLFNSGTIARSATFSFTFTQSGTFDYHCQIHPSMTGKIIVE